MNWQTKPRMTQIFFKHFYKLSFTHKSLDFIFLGILWFCYVQTGMALFYTEAQTKCWAFPWSVSTQILVLVGTKRVFIICPLICSHWDFFGGKRVIFLTFFQQKVGHDSLLLFCISILLPPLDISLSMLDTWFFCCSWSFGWAFWVGFVVVVGCCLVFLFGFV